MLSENWTEDLVYLLREKECVGYSTQAGVLGFDLILLLCRTQKKGLLP